MKPSFPFGAALQGNPRENPANLERFLICSMVNLLLWRNLVMVPSIGIIMLEDSARWMTIPDPNSTLPQTRVRHLEDQSVDSMPVVEMESTSVTQQKGGLPKD